MTIERRAVAAPLSGQEPSRSVRGTGLWWGLLLSVAGALWLGDMSGVLQLPPAVVAMVFAAIGLGFAVEAARDPQRWWAAIPAGALIGLGALIFLVDQLSVRGEWGAAVLLAGSGVGFAAASVLARGQAWAIAIGALLLAVGGIVGLVALLGTGQGTPVVTPVGGGFLPSGVVAALEPFNWVAPLAVLLGGLALVVRTLAARDDGSRRDR